MSRVLRRLPRTSACLLAAVVAAGAAHAGSDLFGALPGALAASTSTPKAGQVVTLTLQLQPVAPASHVTVAFEAPACAVLDAATARRAEVTLEAGHDLVFTTTARIAQAGPCKVVASVVQSDAGARTGWVYAVVLNEAPPAASQPRGRNAAGQATVDAVVR